MRYSGRDFSTSEIESIVALISENPEFNRAQLSRQVCEMLNWRRPDGRLKDMSCRVAMLRMQDDGLLQLPAPRNGNNNGKSYQRRTLFAQPGSLIQAANPKALGQLHLTQVSKGGESHLWNEYIDRYHYLCYQPLPGAQLRYFAKRGDRVIALLGFGAAAWKTAPRDHFIGWTSEQRKQRLHFVINNARFLIVPWVQCRNLASTLLAMATRRLAEDWQQSYGYRPVLVETFVEIPRFRGTCYKAANWIYLGETQGRGKLDVHHKSPLPKKSIWLYPLDKGFKRVLCE